MTANTELQESLSAMLINRWEQAGNKLTALAEELPAEAYEFKPAAEVRTAGGVLRHVAFWNLYVAAVARGKEFDETANELPQAGYATKTKIVQALRTSMGEAVSALQQRAAGAEPKTSELVATFLEHTAEHYGQLAIYARLKGIVPPASRA